MSSDKAVINQCYLQFIWSLRLSNKNNAMISSLFHERSKFIVLGLTGRTGSGCTTAANILENEKADFPKSTLEINSTRWVTPPPDLILNALIANFIYSTHKENF